jgi:hypothetical protein
MDHGRLIRSWDPSDVIHDSDVPHLGKQQSKLARLDSSHSKAKERLYSQPHKKVKEEALQDAFVDTDRRSHVHFG